MIYRGFDKKANEWRYGSLLTICMNVTTREQKHMIMDKNTSVFDFHNNLGAVLYEVEPESIGKSTGCFDKRGTEIFEGDRIDGNPVMFEKHHGFYLETEIGIAPLDENGLVTGNLWEERKRG